MIQLFENGEFELRVMIVGDSFHVQASGLARSLGHRDATNMLANIPSDEKEEYCPDSTRPDQRVWYVTEPGFYRVIGQRQLGRIKNADVRAQVDRFQRWVFHEVLPSIRRYGSYSLAVPVARPLPAGVSEDDMPDLITWKETCFVIRQDYKVRVHVARLRRTLMAGSTSRTCLAYVPQVHHRLAEWYLTLRDGDDQGDRAVYALAWQRCPVGSRYPTCAETSPNGREA